MKSICGHCGGTKADPKLGLCSKCGWDFWVQANDFNKSELQGYIKTAANNLKISVKELKKRFDISK